MPAEQSVSNAWSVSMSAAFILRSVPGRVRAFLSAFLLVSATSAFVAAPVLAREVEPIRLLFVGDLMHHQAQERLAREHRDGLLAGYADRWKFVAPMVSGADIAMANLETAVTGGSASGFPVFNAPVDFVRAAAATGFDVLSFANNHSMDKGFSGFSATLENIKASGLHAAGDGQPLYINVRGRTIGVISFTEFVNAGSRFRVSAGKHGPYIVRHDDAPGRAALLQTIRTMRGRADVVVVFVHWGVEYRYRPAIWAKAWAVEMAEAGADLVVGHHPHVVGPSEWVVGTGGRRAFVAYSLGNFSSGMTRDSTPYGYALEVAVGADGSKIPTLRPVWTYRDGANGQWRTYRTVPAAELEADCAEFRTAEVPMRRTGAATHECGRLRGAVNRLP